MAAETIVGRSKYTYAVDPQWGRRDGGPTAFGVSQGVAGDSNDRIYVFVREPRAEMLVFDRNGKMLATWGYGSFTHPHGVWMSPRNELFLTDRDGHTVSQWTTDGRLIRTWGTKGTPGALNQPFNKPTKAVLASDGEMYVSDGYGQQRVHRFDRDGNLVSSWGEKGTGPGQFVLPHDVLVDERDRVLVCDRENRRVQIFDRDGRFVSEWADWQNPMQIYIRDGLMYVAHARAKISVRTLDGELLAEWDYVSHAEGGEMSPHSLWVDSRGDIYVAEVTGRNGFQKYIKQ
jgi:hypothetical protein